MTSSKGEKLYLNKAFLVLSCIVILLLFVRTFNYVKVLNIPTSNATLKTPNDASNTIEHEEESINAIKEYKIEIVKGDKLVNVLKNYGVSSNEVYTLLASLSKKYDVRKIYEGQSITLTIENESKPMVISLEIEIDPTKKVISIHNDQGTFDTKIINNIRYKQFVKFSYPITGSLFASAISNGLSEQVVMRLVNLYDKRVNLNRDIKDGNTVEILLEKFVDENGQFSYYGNIIYASLAISKKKKIDIYRYMTSDGDEGYFYSGGDRATNKKSQLMLPLKNPRISSNFGNRYHPIYKRMILHKGVDLVAPVGTPVYSSGDGVVEYIGNRGGYGKYIRIRHNQYYSTAYAHLSKFNHNLKVGSVINGGDLIAYSGKTGKITGPHLHYEVLYKGKQINPMDISTVKAVPLKASDLKKFKIFVEKIHQIMQQDKIGDISNIYNIV